MYSDLPDPEQRNSESVKDRFNNTMVTEQAQAYPLTKQHTNEQTQFVVSDDDGSYSEDFKAENNSSSGTSRNKRSSQKRSIIFLL